VPGPGIVSGLRIEPHLALQRRQCEPQEQRAQAAGTSVAAAPLPKATMAISTWVNLNAR